MKRSLVRLLKWLLNWLDKLDKQDSTPMVSSTLASSRAGAENQIPPDRQEFFRLFELQVRMFETRADKLTRLYIVLLMVAAIITLATIAPDIIPKLPIPLIALP